VCRSVALLIVVRLLYIHSLEHMGSACSRSRRREDEDAARVGGRQGRNSENNGNVLYHVRARVGVYGASTHGSCARKALSEVGHERGSLGAAPARFGRPGGAPISLLQLAVDSICQHAHRFRSFGELPQDLTQIIFDTLVTNKELTFPKLMLFTRNSLVQAAVPGIPSISDEWLRHLGQQHCLTALDVSRCAAVTDVGLSHLRGCTEMQSLSLGGCFRITDAGLKHVAGMSQLRVLSCEACEAITEKSLRSLSELSQLTSLNLERCSKMRGGLVSIQGLLMLRTLNLGWCNSVGDTDLRCLGGLTNLTALQLARSRTTDQGVAFLKDLTKLQALGLAGCDLTDACFDTITGYEHLTDLNLEWCSEIDVGFRRLAVLTSLKTLNVAYTAISVQRFLF